MIIEKEKNQPNKTHLNLDYLVQPLESKMNPYNLWKDLQIIIKGKISKEDEGNSNSKEIKEPINPIKTIEQVNMVNKVKSIIFPTIIKLKVNAMLFENLVP